MPVTITIPQFTVKMREQRDAVKRIFENEGKYLSAVAPYIKILKDNEHKGKILHNVDWFAKGLAKKQKLSPVQKRLGAALFRAAAYEILENRA